MSLRYPKVPILTVEIYTKSIENVLKSIVTAENVLFVILDFFEADRRISTENSIVIAEKILQEHFTASRDEMCAWELKASVEF